jgi:carbon-monoxide dehydrogenase medium subunit
MKAASFSLAASGTLVEAMRSAAVPGTRIMGGGQSLGPMLNLRLTQPASIVAVAKLAELGGVSETADTITLGAAVTHAAIADGRTPDFGGGILAGVAEHIAYRAVRNRGTIGGSLCHADPAADWVTVLMALDATALIAGPAGTTEMKLEGFIRGAFSVALAPGEILRAVRIPRPGAAARWGYYKACRKPGEFAHAMAAVLIDGPNRRAVIGATGGRPVVLTGDAVRPEAVDAALQDSGLDPVIRHMQSVALRRALDRAAA